MMKKGIHIIWVIVFALTACRDGEVKPLFDKTADERTAEAIANLKADLVAPANGYRLQYKPNDNAGSFNVFLKFNEDNTVRIQADLAADNGKYFDDTITYRIDSSLGLELIMETNCFFGFLYELDEATFGAEYEFNYTSKTPDNALVFVSKTDPIEPRTRLVFQPVASDKEAAAHLSPTVAANLSTMADDLDTYAQQYKITYDTKDLVVYLSMDDLRRKIAIYSVSRKSNTNQTALFNFETAYTLDGDSLVFETPLKGNYVGLNVSLRSVKLKTFGTSSIPAVCAGSKPIHTYTGVTAAGEGVTVEPTYSDPAGGAFTAAGNFFDAPLGNILLNGKQAYAQLQTDLTGVSDFQIYSGASGITGMGFRLQNATGGPTYAIWQYTLTRSGNKFTFNFATDISIYGNTSPDADITKVKQYILDLTNGGNTYVIKLADMVYEFHNPCTGWSYLTIGDNL